MASDTEITKVRIVIRHLLWQIRDVRNDRDAAWKWVNRFANTLQYQDLEQDPDQYALAILAEARSFNDQKKRNQQMRWVREQLAKEGVTAPTQEQLDDKWLEMYGNEIPQDAPNGNAGGDVSDASNGAASNPPTSCDPFTADGDTREGSRDDYDTGDRGCLEFATSADHYGDAAVGDAADGETDGGDPADDARTTVSTPMRRVPQNEAPAHGFSGGRTAQGTMSRPPEAAAQSGKASALDCLPGKDKRPAKTRDSRQVSATADALVNQTRAGAGTQALESPSSLPSPVRNLPRNKEEVRLFAIDNGLDVDDANDWAEMNLRERHGRDKDGKPIRNWKGAILNYCKAMAAKRETA